MLTIYDRTSSGLVRRDEAAPIGPDTVWIDLFDPTADEDHLVEQALGISVPTRAEMREIEVSSRFYQENGASYMRAFILNDVEQSIPDGSAVTFIVAKHRLVSVRYSDPKGNAHFLQRVERGETGCESGAAVLIGIVETHVERMADLIERMQDEVDELASGIFEFKGRRTRNRRLEVILRRIGKEGEIVARAQESATSLDRVLHFLEHSSRNGACDGADLERLRVVQRDVGSLMEHMKVLTDRIQFLLDATLGMINTEQNQIIKLFSVMAVMLMPPTLIASVYGMNFEAIHEFKWAYGYVWALGLMVLSAVVPFVYFRRKGWL